MRKIKNLANRFKRNKTENFGRLSRRDFFKLSVPAAGLVLFGGSNIGKSVVRAAGKPSNDSIAMVYDTTECLGCRRCEDACRRSNGLEPEYRPLDLSANSLTTLKYRKVKQSGKVKWLPTKWQCMHCFDPTCASVCPTGALHKTEQGPVLYDQSKCIGCQYCVSACPFSVPRFDWESNRMIRKCDFCQERLADGLEPACSGVCPQHALSFGTLGDALDKADKALASGQYVYGLEEAGGTSWLYLSDVSFEQRGLPAVAGMAYPAQSKGMLLPQLGTAAFGAVALGAYSVYLRKQKLKGEQ